MIHIGKPYIVEDKGSARLVSHILNESEHKEIDVFYEVDSRWKEYLCDEQADAFVLPMLLRATITKQNIEVDAPISERLLHNLRHGVLYALSKMEEKDDLLYGMKYHTVNQCVEWGGVAITSKGVNSTQYEGCAVGTGCSLGVDSLSVIKKYFLSTDCLPGYKITHFACFNVGAFGSFNTDATRRSFRQEVKNLESFAKKLGLPVVAVDTNLHDCYPECDFNWSHTYLNMGCVLSLQKLWKRYLYASGYSLENFKFDIHDSARYEPYMLPNLSTESTELIPADVEKSRSVKVKYIMDEQIVKDNITVCFKQQLINNGWVEKGLDNGHRNCGHCEKCQRTMLQLDIYGRIGEYEKVFNLSDWNKQRRIHLARVLAKKNNSLMCRDIASTIPKNYHIPLLTWAYYLIFKLNLLNFYKKLGHLFR